MAIVRDIMTTKVVSIYNDQTLLDARQLMKEHGVRHLPVVDRNELICGLLTQKGILADALKSVEKVGVNRLSEIEKATRVDSVMDGSFAVVEPDTDLIVAGQYFIDNKHGCLPVVERQVLVGIISSVDFVKLAIRFLEK
jgi:CBS domain-containing protein